MQTWKRHNKTQASIEYIIVFSLGFLVLLPIVYLFHSYSAESSEKILTNNIAIIGNDIVNAAESVYYMGRGSRLTLEEAMPDGVTNISLLKNWSKGANELVFEFRTQKQMAFFCSVNINGSFDAFDLSPGLKHIRVEARNTSNYDYVEIDIY